MAEPQVIIRPFSEGLIIQSVPLEPDSLLLTNNLGSTIIGYTVSYLCTPESGEPFGHNRISYNFGVNSNGAEIPNGATRLVTPPSCLYCGQSELTISVDLVILDSGQVLGPDEAGTLAGLEGVLSAQTEIRSLLAQTLTLVELEAELTRKFNEERQKQDRTAMMRGAEFRQLANLARRSPDLLHQELARREANFRPLFLHR